MMNVNVKRPNASILFKACTTYAVIICDPSGVGNFFLWIKLKYMMPLASKCILMNESVHYLFYHHNVLSKS